jgi:hypothetical protein
MIAILILWYNGNTLLTLLFSIVYGTIVSAITHPDGWISPEVLWYGQVMNLSVSFNQRLYPRSLFFLFIVSFREFLATGCLYSLGNIQPIM